MIREINGDVISAALGCSGILCHQVNYFGVMGAGVAASVRDKLLTAGVYSAYVDYCARMQYAALGGVLYLSGAGGVTVANMFCQGGTPDAHDSLTRYDDMRLCFQDVAWYAGGSFRGGVSPRSVFIPGRIGCGIAGGDWSRVRGIIEGVFGESDVTAVIVNWEG